MSIVKSLWASVQGDPVFMRRVNGWLTIFWVVMIPISFETGWITSVTYVSMLSLWALVSGHWSAWQAARVEVKQDEAEEATSKEPRGSVSGRPSMTKPGAFAQGLVTPTGREPPTLQCARETSGGGGMRANLSLNLAALRFHV